MKQYFITGTDTDVGKSVVAALLTLVFKACYWKPVQSGSSDTLQVRQWTELPEDRFFPSTYAFKAALSPDQAAKLENTTIDIANCHLPETKQSLIVEGAGGVFAPLNTRERMIDLIKQLNIPVIIVARGTLGTINHTLLTIEALRQRQIPVRGVVFNGELNPDNQLAIEHWSGVKTLFHLPRLKEINRKTLQLWIERRNKLYDDLTARSNGCLAPIDAALGGTVT